MGIADGESMERPLACVVAAWALLALFLCPTAFSAESIILHDFEESDEGWEIEMLHSNIQANGATEAAGTTPSSALTTDATRRRSGRRSLAVEHHFTPETPLLQLRIKQDEGNMNFRSKYGRFHSLSAWVFLPADEDWELTMFVRSGKEWVWRTGESKSGLGPGWHNIDIDAKQIYARDRIQDFGVQVRNEKREIECTVLVDKIELIKL